MRQSKLFTKTRREAPSDEVSKNAQLLIRAGFINKEMAGVYAYLPLGLKVIERIKSIVREEMDAIGGQEEANTNAPKVKWDSKDTESDMSAEVDEVQRGLASMENLESGSTVFKDWLVDSKTPACGAKHAETASK